MPSNRRRSQRLFLQVPVAVQGKLENRPYSEQTRTIVVNAHGALIQVQAVLQKGQQVVLQNLNTKQEQESNVVFVTPGEGGMFNVAMEFTKPNPTFWHVTFPPEDWSSRHPDAKAVDQS